MDKFIRFIAAVVCVVIFALPVTAQTTETVTTFSGLQTAITNFNNGSSNVIINIGASFNITGLLTISTATAHTLTIRSTNPAAPATLTQGTLSGHLFTVSGHATLTLENIIIDGGPRQDGSIGSLIGVFANSTLIMNDGTVIGRNTKEINVIAFDFDGGGGGVLVSGGTFIMNGGRISENTTHYTSSAIGFPSPPNPPFMAGGGGVSVYNGGTFTMNNGEISDNNALESRSDGTGRGTGGGVSVSNGTFTMNGGKISGNNQRSSFMSVYGGGVSVDGGTFTMNGGEISGNRAEVGGDVYVSNSNSRFDLNGGIVYGTTNIINGSYNLNNGTFPAPNNGVVIAWNRPTGNGPFVYTEGTNTNLAVLPTGEVTAVWTIENNKFGISYENGTNTGFFEIAGVTVLPMQQTTQTVTTFSGLQTAITNFNNGSSDVTISIGSSFNITALLTVSTTTARTLTIRSANSTAPATLTRDIRGELFTISGGATLILEDIIIDGDKDGNFANPGSWENSLIKVEGGLVMNGGAIVRNNYNVNGGGIFVFGGRFTMNGGEISGNTSLNGGGVNINGNGMFIMTNGKINNNTASNSGGGILLNGGELTINGGEISDNTASLGGGVYIDRFMYSYGYTGIGDRTFTMTGGKISGNSGGGGSSGMSLRDGMFTMNGGEISGNTSGNGAIEVGHNHNYNDSNRNGIFTMNDGVISGNTGGGTGGVYIWPNGIFTMTGGEISGNTGTEAGGVFVREKFIDNNNNGMFIMTGGKINGNTATGSGSVVGSVGGVFVGGIFTMNGGEISGNIAGSGNENSLTYDVGGVSVEGIFNMAGGEICGNIGDMAGGVLVGSLYRDFDEFTMTNGKISGNTAYSYWGISGVNAKYGGIISFGGTAIVTNNTKYNVCARTITLLTSGDAPKQGMDIGLSCFDIINNIAPRHVQYFRADDPDKIVVYNEQSGTLQIVDKPDVSVLSPDRIIPQIRPDTNEINITSDSQLTSEFTAGPNPVNRQSGEVKFFWQGKRMQDARLTIFDASGNVVNKVKIIDNALNTKERREVGVWDLTDRRGRVVSEGTYLMRGVVITVDGKRERVAVMVGVK